MSSALRCSLCKSLKSAREFSEAQFKKGGTDAVCNECLSPNRNFWTRWLPTILGVLFLSSVGAFMVCQYHEPKLNMTMSDLLYPGQTLRQAFEDADEWRKSFTQDLYKNVSELDLSKAVRWIKHADPFAIRRSCASFLSSIFQDTRIPSLMKSLREIAWNPKEMKDLIANYAYHTTGLDGNTLTLPETQEVIEKKKCEHCDKEASQSIIEVKNIDQILATHPLLKMDEKTETVEITMQDLIDLNAAILKDLDVPIGLRKEPCGIAKKKILLPMPDELLHLMESYVAWLKEEVNNLKPDDLKSGLQLACDAHTRFLHIHPFVDGNGRLARLLSAMVLRKVGLPAPFIMRETREEYNEAISDATMHEKYKKICQIFYDGVINTLEHMNSLVENRTSSKVES
jgi:Fic family protein